MNTKTLLQKLKTTLQQFESAEESESLAFLVLEHIFSVGRLDILMEKEIPQDNEKLKALEDFVDKLKSKIPIQHIIGQVEFYNRKFLVNSNVLIPRRETEELVYLILKDHPDLVGETIIDIGTGSGVIPITIAKERPGTKVIGIDISTAALSTAQRNAKLNHAEITFIQTDILEEEYNNEDSFIWVSNPPYVTEAEKVQMEDKVLEHEPHSALFVNDHTPLLFYDRIAELAFQSLVPDGYLYFEINEQFGKEVKNLMEEKGFSEVSIIEDMQGKNRFVKGIKRI